MPTEFVGIYHPHFCTEDHCVRMGVDRVRVDADAKTVSDKSQIRERIPCECGQPIRLFRIVERQTTTTEARR
jgi:hypothetical protein